MHGPPPVSTSALDTDESLSRRSSHLYGESLPGPLKAHIESRERHRVPADAGLPCAVLMALFEKEDDVHVLLLRRASGMRRHGGQVAFPGGKFDAEDETLEKTALRETHEEIGLPSNRVVLLGPIDDFFVVSGFIVTPYVAWIHSEQDLEPNPHEVARIFAAPLRTFLVPPEGVFPKLGYNVDGEFVWGATAAMAHSLGKIVRGLLRW